MLQSGELRGGTEGGSSPRSQASLPLLEVASFGGTPGRGRCATEGVGRCGLLAQSLQQVGTYSVGARRPGVIRVQRVELGEAGILPVDHGLGDDAVKPDDRVGVFGDEFEHVRPWLCYDASRRGATANFVLVHVTVGIDDASEVRCHAIECSKKAALLFVGHSSACDTSRRCPRSLDRANELNGSLGGYDEHLAPITGHRVTGEPSLIVEPGEAASDARPVETEPFSDLPDSQTLGVTTQEPDDDVLAGVKAVGRQVLRPDSPHQLADLAQLAGEPLRIVLVHVRSLEELEEEVRRSLINIAGY